MLNLSSKKATKYDDFPAEVLEKSVDSYIKEIIFIINDVMKREFSVMMLN